MSLEKSFCPSPWFHMRINNSGSYEFCRWMDKAGSSRIDFDHNIKNESPLTYFQKTMSPYRAQILSGQLPSDCTECQIMEQHGKVSGRQKQLLKVGVMEDYFVKSLASSPLRKDFDYSNQHNGHTLRTVTDWQIDLGNYCNSACIMCIPISSSRLASEFLKLGLADSLPPRAWCDDPVLVDRFIQDLKLCENLRYLHFLGGETIITPGFRQILTSLVEADMAKNITIGFTTNLTVWDESINNLLVKFKQVNLGLSIETLTPINDYVRWPSKLDLTIELLDRWRQLGEEQNWLTQLRITPTCLTALDLVTVYEYAWEHQLAVESCNFLTNPEVLRIGVLPKEYRQQARVKLANWVDTRPVTATAQVINTRNPALVLDQITQDAQSYLNYLDNADDESYRLPDLVAYLKKLESNRGNSVLDYLPEYEDLLRSAGY